MKSPKFIVTQQFKEKMYSYPAMTLTFYKYITWMPTLFQPVSVNFYQLKPDIDLNQCAKLFSNTC